MHRSPFAVTDEAGRTGMSRATGHDRCRMFPLVTAQVR
ncbi:hypothetical protein CZ771_05625 [Actinomycetales bacterium JB111]|nr:hypothetical protein CZ771_05625 [Actinomycetales bacterium JB111]